MAEIDLYLKRYKETLDKIWFEKIYIFYMPKIYSYFYYKLYDKHLAEDLANEVFIKVFKNMGIKNFNSRNFKVWIYKVAKNNFIDYLRKTKKYRENEINLNRFKDEIDMYYVEKDSFIKNSSFIKKEFGIKNAGLLKAMNKLTSLQQDVVTLFFLEEFDHLTIARVYGKSQSTIRGIIMRALNTLREEMKK